MAHHTSRKNLELTIISWLSAPLCDAQARTCTHVHHSFINLCTQDIAELCSQYCLHFWWTGVKPIFSFCVFCCLPQTHNRSAFWESVSRSLPLFHSPLSRTLSPSLSLSPLLPLLPMCLLKPTDKDCGIDFGKTLCRSFQTVFLFVGLCMAAYNLSLLLSFSAQECPGALPWPDLSSFFLLLIFFSQCTDKATCSLLWNWFHALCISILCILSKAKSPCNKIKSLLT